MNRKVIFLIAYLSLMANLYVAASTNNVAESGSVLIDGIRYELNQETKTAELSCERATWANGQDYTYYYSENYSGDVVIPATVEYEGQTYAVTSIGDGAFVNCPNGLESLTIPASITHISGIAFGVVVAKCAIKNLYLPSLEWWLSVDMGDHYWKGGGGYGPFYDNTVCFNPLALSDHVFWGGEEWDMKSLNVPEGITEIKRNQFFRCSQLTNVTLPATLKRIDDMAFCFTNLTSLSVPSSVESIGTRVFYKCESLADIDFMLPGSLKDIGKEAFSYCAFESFVIPESVDSIAYQAFYFCRELGKFTIPGGVKYLGDHVFGGCYNLKQLTIESNVDLQGFKCSITAPSLQAIISKITVPTDIPSFLFNNYYKNVTLYVPEGTKEAYRGCEGWKEFLTIIEGDATGIESNYGSVQTTEASDSPVYDLQGRRLTGKPQKGIYIQNGRKAF